MKKILLIILIVNLVFSRNPDKDFERNIEGYNELHYFHKYDTTIITTSKTKKGDKSIVLEDIGQYSVTKFTRYNGTYNRITLGDKKIIGLELDNRKSDYKITITKNHIYIQLNGYHHLKKDDTLYIFDDKADNSHTIYAPISEVSTSNGYKISNPNVVSDIIKFFSNKNYLVLSTSQKIYKVYPIGFRKKFENWIHGSNDSSNLGYGYIGSYSKGTTDFKATKNNHGVVLKSTGLQYKWNGTGAGSTVHEIFGKPLLDRITLYLGSSCDAYSEVFGTGSWSWANGGFIVSFKNETINFGRQELSIDTDDEFGCRM